MKIWLTKSNGTYFTVNDSSQAEIVKDLRAVPPDEDRAVLPDALVVEAVNLGDLTRLVVTANERDPVRVADFQGKEEEEGLDAVEPAVDEVPKEEVAGLWNIAAYFEELLQVVELAVDVTANLSRECVKMTDQR